MTRRTRTLIVASVLAAALLVIGVFLPVPYVTLLPGPVTDTLGSDQGQPLIKVTGRQTYRTTGSLDLTTVLEHPRITLFGAVQDWLSGDRAVVPRELVDPPGQSQQQVDQQNTQEMQDSQNAATVAALAELGIKPTANYVTVADVPAGSPSSGKLQAGDRILDVDGRKATGLDQLRTLIDQVKPGEPVTVTYQRDNGKPTDVTITTTAGSDKRPVIGITSEMRPAYPFTVSIGLKDVGGPSAGMMFALGIIDLLTPGDLAGGKVIAGTGTIDDNGAVGSIGGIQQKLLGARRHGATVFLVPSGNCDEAKRAIPGGLQLIKVDTLKQAVGDLTDLRAGNAAALPGC